MLADTGVVRKDLRTGQEVAIKVVDLEESYALQIDVCMQ